MKWEVPPHSSEGFKLIGTEKINGEILLYVIGSKVNREKVWLSHIHKENEALQYYVSSYLPKILSGVYDIGLTSPKPYYVSR
ncbi:hypothetical protein ERJ70_06060 [Sediminibacillus dalangtanensis]|uniref:Uncharacterized protein n=1 Tax=Sediminibacillus dalangtanensis TaxID=2729421 RepID=A0ABX7VPT7_9BACI|nr:hypothetical protein [Sediminibacillus dalangtanensis]QTM98901.1 hypothetical protein ERJ70_06060 [Sediminibacillus dalangtanensis]